MDKGEVVGDYLLYKSDRVIDGGAMATEETHYGPEGRAFYGALTVSERGQVAIPAAARRDFNLIAGDKLIVLGDPAQGLAFIAFDAMGKLFAANPQMAQELGPRVAGRTPTDEK